MGRHGRAQCWGIMGALRRAPELAWWLTGLHPQRKVELLLVSKAFYLKKRQVDRGQQALVSFSIRVAGPPLFTLFTEEQAIGSDREAPTLKTATFSATDGHQAQE